MSATSHNNEVILYATAEVGKAMYGMKYAIVGGAACAALGSERFTEDIDLVVPRGETIAARRRLQPNPRITIDPRTRRTFFDSSVPIEILVPPAMFKGEFTDETPVIEIGGASILKPTLLLNSKCGSIWQRAEENKKATDAYDIKFLLGWLADADCLLLAGSQARAEVPNATRDFVAAFTSKFGDAEIWVRAGLVFDEEEATQ
ncbi:hypothetical protein SPBR_07877 [Sporothrix brasiliensis 5110]|uniref:Nucleotidyltransferase n=1 Tax=Sporothrix brasiliensis 5110 TaxID=1398154 RepID=A0A0C2FC89_9PEZI|nr:uncharacterized protein SPBR_07877 [Sporothrix brasiliensis 5110]KIH88728.1 hypothetical protein SPBR_07877 [Sporothrix brasiliensis 5110]